jgi:uncharacterized membrane protein
MRFPAFTDLENTISLSINSESDFLFIIFHIYLIISNLRFKFEDFFSSVKRKMEEIHFFALKNVILVA